MPQFYPHTPKSQCEMKAIREFFRVSKVLLPIGLIGENSNFAYGYDGEKYYVTEYSILDYFVTKTALSFEEAKALFEALTFVGNPAPRPTRITELVKSARKQKISDNDLFWYFEEAISLI